MDVIGFASKSHVAQQSRRDKLRYQQNSASSQHLEDVPNNHDQLSLPFVLNPDLVSVRNNRNASLLYDPSLFPSENINVLPAQSYTMTHQEIGATQSGTWRSLGTRQSCDWTTHSAASGSFDSNPMPLGKVNDNSAYTAKLNYCGYHPMPVTEISNRESPKQLEELHFTPSLYQNSLQDIVGQPGRGVWADRARSSFMQFDDAGSWTERSSENYHGLGGEFGPVSKKLNTFTSDSNPQGLSLSLSSNPPLKLPIARFEGCGSENPHDSKSLKSGLLSSIQRPSIISKSSGRSLGDIVGVSTITCRNSTGPLGPFTGYATILKSSKFLKPAQQLLDDFCGSSVSKFVKSCEVLERFSGEGRPLNDADTIDAIGNEVKGTNSGASSSTFHMSNEFNDDGRDRSFSSGIIQPEHADRRAKLLYMQEEVCKRYKQYQQQMQMVVTSFESVAGLSSAAPYISFALKTVSRHFQCLKNAISDQLRHLRKPFGEDLSSHTTGTSTRKVNTNPASQRYMEQSFLKNKSDGGAVNMGFLEPQNAWRPQRGLPERAVSILKAWLFEHFLHPYPTDTDKHMLATQTGLSRNQVSNWFINARVRLWKPMVEEIHMLETKGSKEANQNQNSAVHDQVMSRLNREEPLNAISDQFCSRKDPVEDRSSSDYQIHSSMDSSLIDLTTYQPNVVGVGRVGSVSLTLGLRHAQHQQQQQQMPGWPV